jgi:3-hydroxyisobutyrate dehydrogenase-like beta-hydroxyacid dehydrogenase
LSSPPKIISVGLIGTGRIGLPIVGHLVDHGFAVQAYDVDTTKRSAVEDRGGNWATFEELTRGAEVILICVGYDRELRSLIADGLATLPAPGTIVGVLSTVNPRTVQELERRATPAGVAVVDATLCRGARAADAGTLLSFLAGEPHVVERVRPVVASYSADIVYTGAIGTAQVAKAANNLLMWACLIANHEALALAARFGVDVNLLRDALLRTGAENAVLRNWGTSTMKWADDDLAVIQDMARDAGITLPQAELNRELCRQVMPRKFRLEKYGI